MIKKKLSYIIITLLITCCFKISLLLTLFFVLSFIENTYIGSSLISFYSLSLKKLLLEHQLLISYFILITDLVSSIYYISPPNLPSGSGGLGGSSGPGGSGTPGGPGGPGTPIGFGELSGSNDESNRSNRNSTVANSVVEFSEDQLNDLRKSVASKLRQLYIDKPDYTIVKVTDPAYANIIDRLDHNIMCKYVLDSGIQNLIKSIKIDDNGSLKYTGILGHRLLSVLERPIR